MRSTVNSLYATKRNAADDAFQIAEQALHSSVLELAWAGRIGVASVSRFVRNLGFGESCEFKLVGPWYVSHDLEMRLRPKDVAIGIANDSCSPLKDASTSGTSRPAPNHRSAATNRGTRDGRLAARGVSSARRPP